MNKIKYIFAALIIVACKDKTTKTPEYVLNKEEFSEVIVDFTLAESASNINVLNVTGLKGDTVYAFNPLLDRNISREKFDTTLYFYSHHPILFKEVYDLALEKLSRMQASRK